jgi:hypothetical protein
MFNLNLTSMKKSLLLILFIATLTLVTNAQSSVKTVIARETFGNSAFDTNGPAQISGFATHFKATDITTFTSVNGKISGGSDNSVRINNYDATLAVPGNWREPSGGMHTHMAIRDGDSYKGSWDTLFYSGIDISLARPVTAIEFGYARSRTLSQDTVSHKSLNVKYRVDGGEWIQADTSIIKARNVYGKWDYIVMPENIKGDKLDIMFACIQTNEQIFLDDITVEAIVPVTVKKVIARETFGSTAFDTNGPAQTSGFATHFKATDITSFTSTNGTISGGSDNSVRLNNYDGTLTVPSYWREPSGGMHAHMAIRDGDSYKGSWDTLYYSGINISLSYSVTAIEFGYARARTLSPDTMSHKSLNIQYRVDGGEWSQLDTSLINQRKVYGKWDYVVIPVKISGSVLDIRFACIQTNEQIFLDDITVEALTPAFDMVDKIITRETFGNMAFDTNGPAQTSGFATHFKATDITSFSSTNGTISGGSDNSVRLNNYDATLKIPDSWREPSGGMHTHMAIRDGDSYKGSWDTLNFNNIDISTAFSVSAIEFGYAKSRTLSPDTVGHKSLNVKYRVDGGEWIQADTSVINARNVYGKWDYIVMPENIKGDKLDIMFACIQTNEQIFIDDITVMGKVAAPSGPTGIYDFAVKNIVVGTIDSPEDYTCNLNFKWDANNAYLKFVIVDDSLVANGTVYQVDNIEIYFDLDNSKNIHWPRNGGWVSADPTYDKNDFQLRLVPEDEFSANNSIKGVTQVYTRTAVGYNFDLTIPWDSLMDGFEPAVDTLIGFDVLASDNDAVASDPNRNQVTLASSTDKPFNDPSLFGTFNFETLGSFNIIPDEEAPGKASNLTATVVKDAVTLAWDNGTDNVAILYYNVYQSSVLLPNKIYPKLSGNTFKIPALADGKYTFALQSVDNSGNVSASKASVIATVSTVSVNNLSSSKLAVYPNPATSELNIKGVDNVSRIEVIGMTGNIMKTHKGGSTISVAELSKGAYFLKVYTDSDVITTRFIKK